MAERAQSGADSQPSTAMVSVNNLQLPFGITVPDVWGKRKPQPAFVTLHLQLRHDLRSAAGIDALNQNTIHYGELATRIRAGCTASQTAFSFSHMVEEVIERMGRRKNGSFRLSTAVIKLSLSKASMFGECVNLISILSYDDHGPSGPPQRIFSVQDMKIMTLIGVNEYERGRKQPLVASVELYLSDETGSSQELDLFEVEQILVNVCGSCAYLEVNATDTN